MMQCSSCGTELQISQPTDGAVVECSHCGIDLEIHGKTLCGLQLGPSEE